MNNDNIFKYKYIDIYIYIRILPYNLNKKLNILLFNVYECNDTSEC